MLIEILGRYYPLLKVNPNHQKISIRLSVIVKESDIESAEVILVKSLAKNEVLTLFISVQVAVFIASRIHTGLKNVQLVYIVK